ncbi:MAG: AAA family ATPase [Pseudomonadota bacterium]
MKKLPIGIQTFQNLIEEGYYYVDKTAYIKKLAEEGKYYFLSRPRRFGKSLFLSTLKSAYRGQRELFQGLYLYSHWDWDKTAPVVHISFGSGVHRNVEELRNSFDYILSEHARQYAVQLTCADLRNRFAELIQILFNRYRGKVIILVDEYDKPILDNIDNLETAIVIREELKNYYSIIKDSDPYIQLVFITGVSKFSKVSLFSGLNNLEDITLSVPYSAICGYTQEDLKTTFIEWLEGVDLDQVRKWYNGYNWTGEEVYNPFDILLYLRNKEFLSYWFETATPTFLIKLLETKKYYIPCIESIKASASIIGSFDVDRLEIETLLFQTGYLTIKNKTRLAGMVQYELGYPNFEVKQSLTDYILYYLTTNTMEKENNKVAIYEALVSNDFKKLEQTFHAFFASIPHDWYRKNQLAGYEGYYASIVYCYFAALGLDVHPEETTSAGRIDLTIRFENRVYILEFKVVELSEDGHALEQIKSKGYADKFMDQEVYLIGIEFSKEHRNITRFEWEKKTP